MRLYLVEIYMRTERIKTFKNKPCATYRRTCATYLVRSISCISILMLHISISTVTGLISKKTSGRKPNPRRQRERVLSSIDPEKPVCEEKIPLPEEMAEEAKDWWYYDDISGKELLPEKVEKARKDEIDIVESMGVWEKIPRSKVPKGTKIIGTRWVDVNKQDETNPLYRSRLVAQEIKRGSGFDEFFAAMPSLAALKLLLTIAVSDSLPLEKGKRRKSKQSFLGFLDVKRAHFYSKATRELYVEIPSEGKKPEDGDVVGRLVRSLYGTRDAPMNWELTIAEFMKKLGFLQGESNPCIYYHASRELRTEVHGDDFTTVGSFDDIKWFHTSAAKE